MEASSRNFRQIHSIQLSECITSLAVCSQFFAAGCLDDTLYMWNSQFTNFKRQTLLEKSGHSMGIVDMKFNKKNTSLAVSCMDSTIKVWDIATGQSTIIECQVMENWKLEYLDNTVVTCGDLGRIGYYDTTSKERVKKIDVGEIFLTSLAKTNDDHFLAAGNSTGEVFIINLENKDKTVTLRPHYKFVRSLSFLEDSSKLLTASDDFTIKIIDISSEKVISTLEGHKQSVSNITAHPTDAKIAYSCSFDKSFKCWDLRVKSCIGTMPTGSALWDCKVIGKNVIAGGQNGVLNIYSIE